MTKNEITNDRISTLVSDDQPDENDGIALKEHLAAGPNSIGMTSQNETENPNANLPSSTIPLTRRQRCERITSLIIIGFISFLTGVDYAIILPTAWDYLNSFKQLPIADSGIYMGLLLASFSLSGAIAGLIFGHLSDLGVSVKRLILFGVLFKIGGNILYFVGINFYVVIIARMITGIGMGLAPPIIADITKRSTLEKRTALIAKVLACRQIGLFLGPVFTVAFQNVDFNFLGVTITLLNAPGFFMAILWILAWILAVFLFFDLPKPITETRSLLERWRSYSWSNTMKGAGSIFKNSVVIVLLVTSFLAYFNQTALETTITPFTSIQFGWGPLQVSIVFALAGVEITLIYIALHFITKKVSDQILLLSAYIILAIACFIGVTVLPFAQLGSTKYLPIFLLFIGLDILALPLIAVTSTSLFTKQISQELQGIGQGIQRFIISFATVIGPLFAGGLLSQTWLMIATMFLLVLIALLLVIVIYPSFPPRQPPTPPPVDDELAALLPPENKK